MLTIYNLPLKNQKHSLRKSTLSFEDIQPIINAIMESTAFVGADRLWSSMQEKLETYINSHEGSSSKVQPEKYRPNYNKVKAYLKNQVPLSALGCN